MFYSLVTGPTNFAKITKKSIKKIGRKKEFVQAETRTLNLLICDTTSVTVLLLVSPIIVRTCGPHLKLTDALTGCATQTQLLSGIRFDGVIFINKKKRELAGGKNTRIDTVSCHVP
jgi:hypothetical protein